MEQSSSGNPDGPQENSGRQNIFFGNQNDGHLAVSFSESDLELRADFIPPLGAGQPLTSDAVALILGKINVTYGVLWGDINEAIKDCTMGRRQVPDILIAKGYAPAAEVAEYFEMNPALNQNRQQADDNAQIDYRSHSPFIIVKKDQALAKLRPRKPGKEGKNVHGVSLPFAMIRPEGISGGENTRTEKNLILSNINGQLIEKKKVLQVQENLVIKGSVGYSTGNIIFPGDVMIEGPVSDGFKIYSGGSVVIKQTFDVTEAITKGDLAVAGGIIGRGAGLLKVGGGIRTKFIENCRAAARKTITVDSDIINSSVFTMENIEMGDKGLILGGDIYAVHGIKAGGIGRKAGKATRIHCGIDFTAQQEKEKNNNHLHILAAKLAKLKELMAAPDLDDEKRAKMQELERRLEEEQRTAGARVTDLLGQINTDENAVVEVTGEIAPGTLIEICQIALFVDEPLRKVRIRLDKMGGKLVPEPL
ncbi:hypothetical protein AGMMS50293_17680 [Spirochaetia bacterium]|nr:hypothetical protein AGMMS50293_17680 [Spirochaetia bacterium]